LVCAAVLRAQEVPATAPSSAATPPSDAVMLEAMTVSGSLDRARAAIAPELGSTSFALDSAQIANLPGGADAPFTQVLLRAPGVAEDSEANGGIHVRGEHANLQYRINDVLLPEGISGFGQELDPRFVDKMQLITGSLPAQYGFRTAGVVDIQTKTGGADPGGEVSLHGGSFETLRTSLDGAGTIGGVSYFADASHDHNDLGIENPTPGHHAFHDATDQSKLFSYLSYIVDPTSRLSFIGSASYSRFQVPDTPGLTAGQAPDGRPWLLGSFNSAGLNETQNEQNYYAVLAYQKTAADLNYQVSGFVRNSSVHFVPDTTGDLYFNGVASDVSRQLDSIGLQADSSYGWGASHTLRGGFSYLNEFTDARTMTSVFPVNEAGNPTGPAFSIKDRHKLWGLFAGVYLQDEWQIAPRFTVNYGARADLFNSSFDNEHQLSPRINLVWQAAQSTTIHAGYSRYFTPPPVEDISGGNVAAFDGTSNASSTDLSDRVRSERADYYDMGASQTLGSNLQLAVDGYYKASRNQLDDGLFGQSLILSAFNYAHAKLYGVELSASYTAGNFSLYANLARSEALGKQWNSSEFLFAPADFAYVQRHYIHLDHDQSVSGSLGTAYHWKESRGSSRVYLDVIYGNGLRTAATAADGSTIPNGGSVPAYAIFNAGGEHTFGRGRRHSWRIRLDLLNLADRSYQLRDGSGVGVNAAQYGQRFGLFGSAGFDY
jgi:outer membrane receptor protein involved in Fe transport